MSHYFFRFLSFQMSSPSIFHFLSFFSFLILTFPYPSFTPSSSHLTALASNVTTVYDTKHQSYLSQVKLRTLYKIKIQIQIKIKNRRVLLNKIHVLLQFSRLRVQLDEIQRSNSIWIIKFKLLKITSDQIQEPKWPKARTSRI